MFYTEDFAKNITLVAAPGNLLGIQTLRPHYKPTTKSELCGWAQPSVF